MLPVLHSLVETAAILINRNKFFRDSPMGNAANFPNSDAGFSAQFNRDILVADIWFSVRFISDRTTSILTLSGHTSSPFIGFDMGTVSGSDI